MNCLEGVLLFWTVLVLGKGKDALLEKPPEVGFQECRKALNLPVLEVLPGGGWDNLRNVDMGRVLLLQYNNCQTTEDGQYIIPDEVLTIPRKQSNLEMNSEIIESWMNYQSTTSSSINTEVSLFSMANGKFSIEFQKMKTHQVKEQAVTTRVQVRNLVYTAKVNPISLLSKEFKKELMAISDRLENNQTRMANFMAELLVLSYGTHVVTSVDAGAILVQEDQIRASFLDDSQTTRSSITASAAVAFHNIINFKIEDNHTSQDGFHKHYLSNRTNSRVVSIGGVSFYPGITLEVWQKGITNHLVAIDRSGLPLYFFINSDTLPDLPAPLVKKLSKTVEAAVKRYYTFNTYPGCTNRDSPNFNFQANTDDGSCEGKMTNFTFGGVYQECTQISGMEAMLLCPELEQKNPLTGGFSCPESYSPVLLHSHFREEGYNLLECHRKCSLWVFCKKECEDVFRVAKAEFRAFWCVANGQVPENSGFLFGGLFSGRTINPVTNAQSCPAGYLPLRLLDGLHVCTSQDYELGYRFSVPFGGFFSCDMGNPLVNLSHPRNQGGPYLKKCPPGFSQHLALISDGCQVSYCVKAGLFTGGSLPPARLPPFSRPPLMSQAATNTVMVISSESEKSWIKDSSTNLWKLADPSEVRRTITLIHESGSGLSGGATAGITAGVTVVLAALITLAIYGSRRYKKREYEEVGNESRSLIEATAEYGASREVGGTSELSQEQCPSQV
ncbi:macrophage-expressed gene 1 protein [Trichosurus vulpecula]|uniref:macrophage-expressed gene 1 protein n=1 Tax=Trichosurus vulpecula TaxID=9337 RepID=UPI00186B50EA|nr:macrophage-expressed gene 1 protein [Trichosurus vulpecula]